MSLSLVSARFGSYKVVRELGEGGMGVVYEAFDEKLARVAALKVLSPQIATDPSMRARFLREARAAASIQHPNVAAIYAADDENGQLYIAMELVQGESLRLRLARGRLGMAQGAAVAEQVAAALERAHSAGIVHRDLKPENIMLTPEGVPKLLDFGIAKLMYAGGTPPATPDQTLPGQVLGTPGYASPEQISGRATDARADVFSLGVVLYEMLSGSCPFRGSSAGEQFAAAIRDSVPLISTVLPEAPNELDIFLTRCLEKDPVKRYQTAAEVVTALRRVRDVIPKPGGGVDARGDAAVLSMAVASTEPSMVAPSATVDATASTEPRPAPSSASALAVVPKPVDDNSAKTDDAPAYDPFAAARAAASRSRALARIRGVVEAAVRSAAADPNFPPLALFHSEKADTVTLRAVFEPAPGSKLGGTLAAVLICAAQGGEQTTARIECAGALTGPDLDPRTIEPPTSALTRLLEGVADDGKVGESIRGALGRFLQVATSGSVSARKSDVVWLQTGT